MAGNRIKSVKNPKTLGLDLGFEIEPVEEETGRRVIETDSGVEYHAVAKDPFGHFTIYDKHGNVAKEFTGAYTSVREAERAISQYLGKK